jgi:hypothetical protein
MQAFIVDLPNRPGSLAEVSEALGAGGVNIAATGATTSGSAGTVAFSTDDEAGARGVLQANDWPFREVELVVASLEDRPGSLGEAARRLATAGVNLESMFATGMDDGKVQIAFGVSDAGAARAALGDLAG